MKKQNLLFLVLSLTAMLFSCSKDDVSTEIPAPHTPSRVGFYLLSEGSLNADNSKLSFFDLTTGELTQDYFGKKNNGAKIGDTAVDIVSYGGKAYIIVNNSKKVIVINNYTGAVIGEIEIENPRYGVGANGKIYVSSWKDGVAVIDTTTLSISKKITLSQSYSEGIVADKENLYVANSGIKGDAFGGKGSTISIVSLTSEEETSTITVPLNPNRLAISKSGDLFVSTWGDYFTVDAQLSRINLKTKEVTTIKDLSASKFALGDKYAYTYHYSYIKYEFTIMKVDLATLEVTTMMDEDEMRAVGLRSIYDVAVDPINNDVYYLDEAGIVVALNQKNTIERKYKDLGLRVNSIEFLSL